MQLSTRQAALYYYDYVFIKDIRRRQRTTGATRTTGVDEGGMHQPDVPTLPEMKDGIWRRPKGCGGPWAQKQARGAETDPQAAHGPPEALRRELGGEGAMDVDKGREHPAGATYACEVRRKLSRTPTDSALLNR